MGEIRVQIDLINSFKPDKRARLQAVIDSEAMVNWLPYGLVEELELRRMGTIPIRFDDETIARHAVYGPVTLELHDRSTVTDFIAPTTCSTPRLSIVTLERLDLELDPVEGNLRPRSRK